MLAQTVVFDGVAQHQDARLLNFHRSSRADGFVHSIDTDALCFQAAIALLHDNGVIKLRAVVRDITVSGADFEVRFCRRLRGINTGKGIDIFAAATPALIISLVFWDDAKRLPVKAGRNGLFG